MKSCPTQTIPWFRVGKTQLREDQSPPNPAPGVPLCCHSRPSSKGRVPFSAAHTGDQPSPVCHSSPGSTRQVPPHQPPCSSQGSPVGSVNPWIFRGCFVHALVVIDRFLGSGEVFMSRQSRLSWIDTRGVWSHTGA